jgi:fructoselysine 6-kinase
MIRVVGVGDNTVDQYLHLGQMFPGGNAVNVAVLAQRYGHRGSYLGWLGNDVYGRLILGALREEGIDTAYCRIIDGENAHCAVDLVNGDRVFGASTAGVTTQLALTDEDLAYIAAHDLAHTSIYSHIERDLPGLKPTGAIVSFDFSSNWTREYLKQQLPYVDFALLSSPLQSVEETESLMRWVYQQGPRLVLVTQGSAGARVLTDGHIHHVGIVETEVIDTLGAGDSFIARFLVEYLGGTAIPEALQMAAQSAAHTCTYYGAFGHGAPIPANG